MKKIIAGSLMASLLVVPAMAQDVSVYLNNERMVFDQNPIIENGRTLVPLRSIFEGLGAEVKWNPDIQEIKGITKDKEVILRVGETSATVNGNTVTLDVAAKIENGRTLVPLRFISESLEAKVKWNAEEYRIDIENKKKVNVNVDKNTLEAWTDLNNLYLVGEITDFDMKEKVTRAEFVKMLCKILGAENTMQAQSNMPSSFKDVPTGELYTGDVNLLDGFVIDSKKEKNFRPNEIIDFDDAITYILKALGRGAYIDAAGEWPDNYRKEADKLGLSDNVRKDSGDLNYDDFVVLIHNALDIKRWDVTETDAKGNIISSETKTLREMYFKRR